METEAMWFAIGWFGCLASAFVVAATLSVYETEIGPRLFRRLYGRTSAEEGEEEAWQAAARDARWEWSAGNPWDAAPTDATSNRSAAPDTEVEDG